MTLTASVTVAALAACSSGPQTVALPEFVSKVNAVCTTYAVKMEALAAPSFDPASTTAAELPAAAKYLDQAVPLLNSEQGSIKAVGEPQASRSLYASVLTALAAHVRDETDAQTAAHAKNLAGFRAAVTSDQSDSTHLAGVAQQFGLDKCA